MDVKQAYEARVRNPIVLIVCAECVRRRELGQVVDSPIGPIVARPVVPGISHYATITGILRKRGQVGKWKLPTAVSALADTTRTSIAFECPGGHRREVAVATLRDAVEKYRAPGRDPFTPIRLPV